MKKIDKDSVVNFLEENKDKLGYVLYFFMGLICYMVGVYSVKPQPKEVVCSSELKTIKKQFEQLSDKDAIWTDRLRSQRDTDNKECLERIKVEVERANKVSDEITCQEVCSLYGQCESAGRCF